tara:strand:+ start:321 stop:584 length:264 start_codon:yes stop_codon:yes gene_type:complete
MTTNYYKDKVLKLQQMLDEKDDEIKMIKNELCLCKETPKYSKKSSKGKTTATPLPRFEPADVATILEGRISAMKNYNKKLKKGDKGE